MLGGGKDKGIRGVIAKVYGASFSDEENELNLPVVMVAYICEYTKNIDLYALNG